MYLTLSAVAVFRSSITEFKVVEMANMTLSIPEDLFKKMKKHKELK